MAPIEHVRSSVKKKKQDATIKKITNPDMAQILYFVLEDKAFEKVKHLDPEVDLQDDTAMEKLRAILFKKFRMRHGML